MHQEYSVSCTTFLSPCVLWSHFDYKVFSEIGQRVFSCWFLLINSRLLNIKKSKNLSFCWKKIKKILNLSTITCTFYCWKSHILINELRAWSYNVIQYYMNNNTYWPSLFQQDIIVLFRERLDSLCYINSNVINFKKVLNGFLSIWKIIKMVFWCFNR